MGIKSDEVNIHNKVEGVLFKFFELLIYFKLKKKYSMMFGL